MKLNQAMDLKAKVRNLIQECSEVMNYLTVKENEINQHSSELSELSSTILKAKEEKDSITKALKGVRHEYENTKKSLEELKSSYTKEVESIRKDADRDRDEAAGMLSVAKQVEAELNRKIAEVQDKRKEIEAQQERILAALGKGR